VCIKIIIKNLCSLSFLIIQFICVQLVANHAIINITVKPVAIQPIINLNPPIVKTAIAIGLGKSSWVLKL